MSLPRITLALGVAMLMPALSSGQGLPLTPHGLPLPQIGLPLPQVGLPLPQIGLPPVVVATPAPVFGNQSRNIRRGRRQDVSRWPMVVFVAPPMWPMAFSQERHVETPPPVVEPPKVKGNLVFDVQPGTAQVFVDGYYVGIANDFNSNARALALEVGAHTIEVDEPGYETLRFDVRIDSREPTVYRRALTRVPSAPAAQIPAGPVYLIPGCYLGNVPPKDAGLPATCDPARVVRLR